MNLSQQERSKRLAGLAVEIVARGVVAASLQATEGELAALAKVAQPANGN